MVSYCYTWTPLVLVAGVVLLTLPWLGLLALIVVVLLALGIMATLAWAIVAAPLALARAVHRRWQHHHSTTVAAQPKAVAGPARALAPVTTARTESLT